MCSILTPSLSPGTRAPLRLLDAWQEPYNGTASCNGTWPARGGAIRLRGGAPPDGVTRQSRIGALEAPRTDYLTYEQAQQLHCELLAGNEQPPLPSFYTRTLAIVDGGCATTMGNHRGQFEEGSLYPDEAKVNGAGGSFKTKEKGTFQWPMQTRSHGMKKWREEGSICNESCAYVLLSIGRESIEKGVELFAPAWGGDGYFRYPNGVTVEFHNRRVYVLRPLGYKPSPHALVASDGPDLGLPDGAFVLYIGSGNRRDGDVPQHFETENVPATVVCIDPLIGGVNHDITKLPVAYTLVKAGKRPECLGAVCSIRCRTYSAALFGDHVDGKPGKPYRDYFNTDGIRRADGSLPLEVLESNAEITHVTEVAHAIAAHSGFVMAEQPTRRAPGRTIDPQHALKGCESATHMFDHRAWRHFTDVSGAVEIEWDQCMTADNDKPVSETSIKSTIWYATPNIAKYVRKHFGRLHCNHGKGVHRRLLGVGPDGKFRTPPSEV